MKKIILLFSIIHFCAFSASATSCYWVDPDDITTKYEESLTFCYGSSISLMAQCQYGDDISSLSISFTEGEDEQSNRLSSVSYTISDDDDGYSRILTLENLSESFYLQCTIEYDDGHEEDIDPLYIEVYDELEANLTPSSQTVLVGDTPEDLSLILAGGSGDYSYQWQKSTDEGSSWTTITGVTGETYTPGEVTQDTYYRIYASDDECGDFTSNSAIVTVYNDLDAGEISSNQTICNGDTPEKITGEVSSGCTESYTYQWQSSTDGSTWSDISNATAKNYQPGALTQTTYYRRTTTDTNCGDVYSNSVTVTVYDELSAGSISSAQTICYSTTPSTLTGTTATGGAENYTYQWQSSTNNSTWSSISGATNTNYSPGALTTSTYYRRKVTDDCTSKYTSSIKITVYDDFNAGTISSNQTICQESEPDELTGTTASGGSEDYSYQWQKSTDNSTWANIDNEDDIDYQPDDLTTTTYFRRKDTDEDCGSYYTNTITITVYDDLSAGSKKSGNETICYNSELSEAITYTDASGGSEDYSYQWQKSTNGSSWSIIEDATSESYTPSALTSSTYYRREVIDNTCGTTAYASSTLITVLDDVEGGDIADDQTICYGETPEILASEEDASGGENDFEYTWYYSTNNVNWTSIDDAGHTYYQPDSLTKTTYFKRKVVDYCSSDYSNSVTITVYDEFSPGTIGEDQTIASGSDAIMLTTSKSTSGGSKDYSYQWQYSTDSISWYDINGASNSYYTPQDVTTLTYYRREDTDSNCGSEYSNTITITVYEELNGGETSIEDDSICYDTTPGEISCSESYGGSGDYSYQWQYSTDADTWTNISDATEQTYTPDALTVSTYYRRQVTDSETELTAKSSSIYIYVYEELSAGVIIDDQTICYGTIPDAITTGTSSSGGSGDYTYEWQYSTNNVNWYVIDDNNYEYYQPEELTIHTYYRKKVTDECGTTLTSSIKISVYDEFSPGTIGDDQTITYGSDASTITTSTNASGGSESYSYQWQKSTNGETWTEISDATDSYYQPEDLTITTYYRRLVTDNSCGEDTTNTVTITVTDEDAVIGTIGEDQTICYNTTPEELTSSGAEGISSIQWQESTDGDSWSDVTGETDETYQPVALTQTTYYRIEAETSQNGTLYSDIVTITVEDEFSVGTIGEDQNACENCSISPITTTEEPSSSSNIENQWQQSSDGTTWEDIDGETEDYLNIDDLEETTYFRKKVTTDCGEDYTNTVTITIYSTLVAGSIGDDQTIDYNTQPDELTGTTATGGSGDYTYQWQYSYDEETWYSITDGTDVSYQPDSLTQTTYFRRKVSQENCTTVYTNTITITVESELDAGTIGSNQTICYGAIPDELTGTSASGGSDIYGYYWESSTDGETWNEIFGENEAAYQPDEMTELTYFRRKVESGSATAYSNTIYVKTLDQVEVPTISTEDSYCSGEEVTLEVNTSNTVVWYDSDKEEIQTSSEFTFTADPDAQYYYTVINSNNCSGDITAVDLTIDYVEASISDNYDDIENVTNGDNVTFYPNIESNEDESDLDYTWSFINDENGKYITLYDMEPEEYFHWEGWYSIELDVEMPSGCQYAFNEGDYMYVLEEEDDDATKNGSGEIERVSDEFGTQSSSATIIDLYPNPVEDILYIKVENNQETLPLKIYAPSGSLILQDTINEQETLKTINTSNLSPGIYFISIGSSNFKVIKK